MIYIDPSELRETSNLLRYLSDVVYKPLSGLEALTGADVMISSGGLPSPLNDTLVLSHIKGGAKLIQLKFGHDLPASIVDDRIKDAQSRMLSTGANPWQMCLMFIGLLGYDDTKGMATVDGQLTYGDYPMKWANININLLYWIDRGGHIFTLSSGKRIPETFSQIQGMIDAYTGDKKIRQYYPKSPVFYHEIESDNPTMREWGIGQKLERIEDLRQLIMAIPGARIGQERATAIFNWMAENGIRQDFRWFLSIVNDNRILEVPGIGKKILQDIRWGLYRTLEERNDRNERSK
jgi:hypothetical protein